MKTIKLAHGVLRKDTSSEMDYKVLVVKNSTVYHPGQILDREEVDVLCKNINWDVTIVSLVTN